MNLLLDTHVAIWAAGLSHRLPAHIRDIIADPGNLVFVSAATLWEIAIKFTLSKRHNLPFSAQEARAKFLAVGYRFLPVMPEHAVAVETLPGLHGDPFDRLLVAQAVTEPMRLISHDRRVGAYSNTFITW